MQGRTMRFDNRVTRMLGVEMEGSVVSEQWFLILAVQNRRSSLF